MTTMRFESPRSRTRSLSYYRRGQLLPQCAPPKPVSKFLLSASCILASTLKVQFSIFDFQLVGWLLHTGIRFLQKRMVIWFWWSGEVKDAHLQSDLLTLVWPLMTLFQLWRQWVHVSIPHCLFLHSNVT